ncbi:hypothetical protein BGZ61DRAFT_87485 [Ilyonectria robusta]|uniref:uncharacterized protein n=1 Tax=Ilyonectria robusta TaxID=1079257 RepID=UPI001E8EAE9B|nr:uncharacterized protein BGZ61DRAFT_87485 [Ilyonectria robusta]KAH8735880.1 hypothetical protein BGZ61DRAFT_87485 [Ilyonectria robusta]
MAMPSLPLCLPRAHAHFPVTGDYDVQGQQIITMQRGVIRDSTGDGIANTAVAPQPHRIAGMFHDARSGSVGRLNALLVLLGDLGHETYNDARNGPAGLLDLS